MVFDRYNSLIFNQQAAPLSNSSVLLTNVVVNVQSMSELYPQLDTDESYSVTIPDTAFDNIIITSKTVYGALRGIESLSQLVYFDYDSEQYQISGA